MFGAQFNCCRAGSAGAGIFVSVCAISTLLAGAFTPATAVAQDAPVIAIVVHGGAGNINRADLTGERESSYRAGLEQARDAGYAVLERGGSSLDAVVAAVRSLEDNPGFNAGHGAVLNHDGVAELDASIMDGKTLAAGAVAGVKHVKNPIELARRVMEQSPHVLIAGTGAEEFAIEQGFELVPSAYFRTDLRIRQLERALRYEKDRSIHLTSVAPATGASGSNTAVASTADIPRNSPFSIMDPNDSSPWGTSGTVGAVALDREGNLASATSTGGMTNKRAGRIGDSPIIGAGTYANNRSCAVSATGDGEFFMRAVVAHDVCAVFEYKNVSLEAAAHEVIHEKIGGLKATGGVIALDRAGHIVMEFNSEGMFRAARDSNGRKEIAIYGTR